MEMFLIWLGGFIVGVMFTLLLVWVEASR